MFPEDPVLPDNPVFSEGQGFCSPSLLCPFPVFPAADRAQHLQPQPGLVRFCAGRPEYGPGCTSPSPSSDPSQASGPLSLKFLARSLICDP